MSRRLLSETTPKKKGDSKQQRLGLSQRDKLNTFNKSLDRKEGFIRENFQVKLRSVTDLDRREAIQREGEKQFSELLPAIRDQAEDVAAEKIVNDQVPTLGDINELYEPLRQLFNQIANRFKVPAAAPPPALPEQLGTAGAADPSILREFVGRAPPLTGRRGRLEEEGSEEPLEQPVRRPRLGEPARDPTPQQVAESQQRQEAGGGAQAQGGPPIPQTSIQSRLQSGVTPSGFGSLETSSEQQQHLQDTGGLPGTEIVQRDEALQQQHENELAAAQDKDEQERELTEMRTDIKLNKLQNDLENQMNMRQQQQQPIPPTATTTTTAPPTAPPDVPMADVPPTIEETVGSIEANIQQRAQQIFVTNQIEDFARRDKPFGAKKAAADAMLAEGLINREQHAKLVDVMSIVESHETLLNQQKTENAEQRIKLQELKTELVDVSNRMELDPNPRLVKEFETKAVEFEAERRKFEESAQSFDRENRQLQQQTQDLKDLAQLSIGGGGGMAQPGDVAQVATEKALLRAGISPDTGRRVDGQLPTMFNFFKMIQKELHDQAVEDFKEAQKLQEKNLDQAREITKDAVKQASN